MACVRTLPSLLSNIAKAGIGHTFTSVTKGTVGSLQLLRSFVTVRPARSLGSSFSTSLLPQNLKPLIVSRGAILPSGRSLATCAMPDQDEHEDSSETAPTVLRPTTQQLTAPHPAATNCTVVLTQPRDPGTFSGSDSTDVEERLQLYERVSALYNWDPTLMLANIIFYLDGTAKLWFSNYEEDITSWDICKQKLIDLFGKPIGRRRAAQKELASRLQSGTESYVTYIHVLALCRKVGDKMPKSEKVAHILKGIADDAFNLLVFRNSSTVDDVINECRRFEGVKSRRITPHFSRLPNTAATSTCEDACLPPAPAASDNIVCIVRHEIEAASPLSDQVQAPDDSRATISLIKSVVRQELANAGLQTLCPVNRPDYRLPSTPNISRGPNNRPRYRNPAEW
ncbi:uncharacterized protein LOC119175706 [Rhipicephalus microplus]|uniref:uncharacterized protein LOC119175706 n=1 Tax=Rhipicephalus microplus TaxID=6941 RepID=UPI003F6C83F3